MYNVSTLITAVSKLEELRGCSSAKVLFPFDLDKSDATTKQNGIVAATDNNIYVIINGYVTDTIDLSSISAFSVTTLIGCRIIEYKTTDGNDHILCRGSELYSKVFTAAAEDLTELINGNNDITPMTYPMGNACPTCGRPLTPGSEICAKCAGKKSYVSRLMSIASPWKWMIILSVILYFITSAVSLLPPYVNRILVDEYIKSQNPFLVGFISLIVTIFIINILNIVLTATRSLLLIDAGSGFVERLRQITFDKIQSLSISRINARTSGELINRVSSDTETIKNFIVNEVGEMIQMAVTLVTVSVILFAYNWKIALLVLCPMPIIVYLNRYIRRWLHKFFKLSWTTSSKASSVLHDIFSGIRVVKSFGMEKREIERHEAISDKERNVHIRTESFAGSIMPLIGFLLGVGEFFIMYYVGSEILEGRMTFGEMAQFSSYVAIIYGPLNWISRIPNILSRTGTSLAKIFDILDEESEVVDKADAKRVDIDGEIVFENLTFAYDVTNPVLRNVSATIKKGEMIGIVGRSGVGKSTLINLVMRLYDPQDGAVKIDGHDLRDISQECLRSQIGVVLQETYLFSGTILDNIRYAKPEATREEIIAVAKLAGAHKFIIKLPDGYNTKVGERGYSLSGGERQRVSIARALLRNPKILILDEATSALDTETEKEVQDVLYELTRGRTTLAIAHRLSTLRNADKILVLDKGCVAEFDSHEELMKKRGIYYELVMAQRQMSRIARK